MIEPDFDRIAAYPYPTAASYAVSLFLARMLGSWGDEVRFINGQVSDWLGVHRKGVRAPLNVLVMDKESPWEYRTLDTGRHVVALRPAFHMGNPEPITHVVRDWEGDVPLPENPEYRLEAARRLGRDEILRVKNSAKQTRRQKANNRIITAHIKQARVEGKETLESARWAFRERWARFPHDSETWKLEHWIETGEWPTRDQVLEHEGRTPKADTSPHANGWGSFIPSAPFEIDWHGPPPEWLLDH
ncbi:hypothetical protein ACWG8W_06335 [Citricoccus zhacaiensis]